LARRILVVDDERLSRLMTQSVLERMGYEVVTLADGRGAADEDASGDLVGIIMDCQMPFMDGFTATAEIRRQGSRTPIIGLSSRCMEGDDEVAIAKGMDAYMIKPITLRKVRDTFLKLGMAVG
jgi:CheY-like chemotaxis protein